MKTRLDEVKRMQRLAGIANPNYAFLQEADEKSEETPSEPEKSDSEKEPTATDASSAPKPNLAKAEAGLESIAKKVGIDADIKLDPGVKGGVQAKVKSKSELKEAIDPISIALLLPLILETLGSAINFTTNAIVGDLKSYDTKKKLEDLKKELEDAKAKYKEADKANDREKEAEFLNKIKEIKEEISKIKGSKVGNWLKHAGHKLHEIYVKATIKPIVNGFGYLIRTRYGYNEETKKYETQPGSEKIARLGSDENYRQYVSNIIFALVMVGMAGQHIVHAVKDAGGIAAIAKELKIGPEAATVAINFTKGASSVKEAISNFLNSL